MDRNSNATAIPLEQCKHGMLYRLRSRNLKMGVFSSETSGFVGIRTKFGSRFLDHETYRGADDGTALPLEELEPCPIDPVTESLPGSVCSECGTPCAYVEFADGHPRTVAVEGGFSIEVRGAWQHLAPTECQKVMARYRGHPELFVWLDERTLTAIRSDVQ